MRPYVTFVLLLLFLAGFGAHVYLRPVAQHRPAAGTGSGSSAATAPSRKDKAEAKVKAGSKKAQSVGQAVPQLMKRPLRTTALGWESLVPLLVANRGPTPGKGSLCAQEGLDLQISVADQLTHVESALARGGADRDGADVALLPLPAFVAALERTRALAPRIFFVAGWSNGRDGLESSSEKALLSPAKGEVRLVGSAGESATLLGLFLLDASGVPPRRVRLVPVTDAKAATAPLAAVERVRRDEPAVAPTRRLLLTTSDVSRLIPIVAVAPAGFVRGNEQALAAWARCWLAGAKEMQADVPAAARLVAAMRGAPAVLDLLSRLGQITPSTLHDNARAAGLAGRGAVTIEALFQRTFRLWRELGVLSAPAPESAPLSIEVIAELARRDVSMAEAGPAAAPGKPKPIDEAALAEAKVLLVYSSPPGKLDDNALAATVGLFAGVFERSPVRVSVREGIARARRVVSTARSRFDLAERVFPAAKPPLPRATATIEVVAAP